MSTDVHKIGVEKLELKVMMKVFKVGTVSHVRLRNIRCRLDFTKHDI